MVDDTLGISECGVDSIVLNSYINTKIEMKNLKFGISSKKTSKCHHMHISKSVETKKKCPNLKAHESVIEKVECDTYVGDEISSDGKFDKTIEKRFSKATGTTSEIMNIIKEISLGQHYFHISMIFRNLKFINSVLTNAEVWHPIQENSIKNLEKADKILLRKILSTPSTTSIELLYLETGSIPLMDILKCRRINYLHYILNSDSSEMLYKVFISQIRNPTKGDWPQIVKKDLADFNITFSFEEIKKIKKDKFKRIVKEACKKYSYKKLMNKKAGHEKGKHIKYNQLKIANYLVSDNITTEEAKMLFKIRTDMIEVKENFKHKFMKKSNTSQMNEEALLCPLCKLHVDNVETIFQCSALGYINNKNVKFQDFFSQDMNKVSIAIKEFKQIWKIRQQKLE